MAVEQSEVMRAMATSSSRISSSFQKNVFSQPPALETSKQTSALGHVFQAVHTMQLEPPNASGERRPTGTAPRMGTGPALWAVRSTGWLGQDGVCKTCPSAFPTP